MTELFRNFFKYVSLNILGMIGLSCYILADTFFIARGLGSNGLTALNLAIPVYSLMHGAGLMTGMGGATRFSLSKEKTAFSRALFLDFVLALIFITAAFFTSPLATLLGADESTLTLTTSYLRVILLFSPLFLLNNCIICFVRNDGAPNLSMLGMLIGSLSNIVLDYVFIFPFGWGMTGAALATGVAPLISLIIMSSHFIRKKNTFHINLSMPKFKDFKDICALGSSALINELASGIVMLVFNFLLLDLSGNMGVAAYGIVANVAIVVISVFTGIAEGMQPLQSRFYGRGDKGNAKTVLKMGLILSVSISLLVYAVSFALTHPIVELFNKDGGEALSKMAGEGLRLYFISFVFSGLNILLASYYAATDRPKQSLLISIGRGFALIIPCAIILSYIFGITGVWLSITAAELIVLLFIPVMKKAES